MFFFAPALPRLRDYSRYQDSKKRKFKY